MKLLIKITAVTSLITLLTACGGGDTDPANEVSSTGGTNIDTSTLIISNGRGTLNGNQTEKPEK